MCAWPALIAPMRPSRVVAFAGWKGSLFTMSAMMVSTSTPNCAATLAHATSKPPSMPTGSEKGVAYCQLRTGALPCVDVERDGNPWRFSGLALVAAIRLATGAKVW